MGQSSNRRIWAARLLIGVVFFINVQCALQFLIWPGAYTAAYELAGPSSETIVRSFGICFLMWNATYPPAIAHPERHRVLFGVIIAQQVIGLIGESLLYANLDPSLSVLGSSIMRFIVFDAAGLICLVCAFFLSRKRAFNGMSDAPVE